MRAWMICFALATAACHGSHDGESTDTDTTSGGPDVYAAGIEKASAGGLFTVALTFDPDLSEGVVDAELVVTDDQGAPVLGATVDVVPTMPSMGHGTDPVSVTEVGGGVYSATGVNFTMGGEWQVDVEITAGGSSDVVTFLFDI